ncbi:MAG: hypothetical protein II007_01840 [Gammaproteobacteria bacterium]|nr:hypothetical protein [Gammaproteobacteria bacterium]
MLRSLLTATSLLLALPAAASFCPDQPATGSWGLSYQLDNNGQRSGTLEILRHGSDTALYNPDRQIGEWWVLADSKRPRFHRLFGEQQRRIDYTTGDLRALGVNVNIDSIESFAMAPLLSHLKAGDAVADCPAARHYSGEINGSHYEVNWHSALKLPLLLETRKAGQVRRWQANALINEPTVNQRFGQWLDFQPTDFADIGDMETDPFLAKLITQGFIEHAHPTAYNSDGTVISSEGDHAGHGH